MTKTRLIRTTLLLLLLLIGLTMGFIKITESENRDLEKITTKSIEKNYLSNIYNEQTEVRPKMWDEVFDETKDTLKMNSLEGRVENFSVTGKYVKVAVVAPEQTIYEIKGEVIKSIENILNAYDYEGFDITLFRKEYIDEPVKIDSEIQDENTVIDDVLQEILENHKIWRYGTTFSDNHKYSMITLGISDNDERNDLDVKELFQDIVLKNGFLDPLIVEVQRFDVKEHAVKDIYLKMESTLNEGLSNKSKELKIANISWSEINPSQVSVKTSVLYEDENAQKLGSEIETIISDFLQDPIVNQFVLEANEFLAYMGEEKLSIDANEIFEIVVLDKNNNQIN
ncbi:hypothetical protein ACSVDA_14315 [Cytobacillus sp. Hm23]